MKGRYPGEYILATIPAYEFHSVMMCSGFEISSRSGSRYDYTFKKEIRISFRERGDHVKLTFGKLDCSGFVKSYPGKSVGDLFAFLPEEVQEFVIYNAELFI